jgi:hypothetical protein
MQGADDVLRLFPCELRDDEFARLGEQGVQVKRHLQGTSCGRLRRLLVAIGHVEVRPVHSGGRG